MAEGRLIHAYLLVGPDEIERDAAALRLAQTLVCSDDQPPCGRCRDCQKALAGNHPDVIFVERQEEKGQHRREIVVEQIRNMTADAVIAPNEARRKVYIISQADKMNTAAQNALLKALEDPPGHACFILCAAAWNALLPTVRSRCVRVDEESRQEELLPLSDLASSYIELAAAGNLSGMVLFCMSCAGMSREEAEELLRETKDALCDMLCSRRPNLGLGREKILAICALLERAQDYLQHNVSPKQVFGILAAETLR